MKPNTKSYLILIHIRWKLSTDIHFAIYNGFQNFLKKFIWTIGFLGNFHSMIEFHVFPCYQSNLIWIPNCKFHVLEDGYNLCLGLCCYKFSMTSSPFKGFLFMVVSCPPQVECFKPTMFKRKIINLHQFAKFLYMQVLSCRTWQFWVISGVKCKQIWTLSWCSHVYRNLQVCGKTFMRWKSGCWWVCEFHTRQMRIRV